MRYDVVLVDDAKVRVYMLVEIGSVLAITNAWQANINHRYLAYKFELDGVKKIHTARNEVGVDEVGGAQDGQSGA